ncbi:hypothetical protein D1007_07514 [Hordeum vulgare]|uniref:Uncharacterized protein n=1 Tax=Hordeum vulgare subsp. vulgare TaxID=112509 RepID=A0A8I6Y5U4_HORVV|nr:hypothetical protein D1007_07514 [Hordeum vulgare]KAI4987142.1 hypothetical protein ZWY2020_019942 [Hordeum vulgare]KAI4987145.1 hypothetical protein ZWY2020_019945 [Hordeum vulgare]
MKSTAARAAGAACMPRLTRGRCRASSSTARPAASVSLLERVRDVVLRLIMLTAVSKASVHRSSSSSRTSSPRAGRGAAAVAVTCRRDESIRNEAVEECIEFLKRSSAEGEAVKLSSVTAEAVAAAVASENGPEPKRLSSSSAVAVDAAVAVAGVEHAPRPASPSIL